MGHNKLERLKACLINIRQAFKQNSVTYVTPGACNIKLITAAIYGFP
jgi:hypothetical protein